MRFQWDRSATVGRKTGGLEHALKRQKEYGRRMSFGVDHNQLLAALTSLPRSRVAALRALPELLSEQGEGHTTVSIVTQAQPRVIASNTPELPAGTLLPEDGVIAQTARSGGRTYLTDTANDPRYRSFENSYPVELALPLRERGEIVAVLNIERNEAFMAEELHTLEVFASCVSERLTEASNSLEARITAALSTKLVELDDPNEAATIALEIVAGAVGATAAVIATDQRGRIRPVAEYNSHNYPAAFALLKRGVPYPQGILWRSLITGEAQLSYDYATDKHALESHRLHFGPTVVVFTVGREADHAVLALQYDENAQVSAADMVLLTNVSKHLGIILNGVHAYELQERLFELHTRTSDKPTSDLYQQILETAIEHVPGAQAGTLLVRRNRLEAFSYTAISGFDRSLLEGVALEERNMLAWYARSTEEWRAGTPRALSDTGLDLVELSLTSAGRDEPVRAGDLTYLKSTACLPITHRGEVLAVLNLDNFTRADAFSRDSLRTLTQFAQPVASLIGAAHYRDELERASATDQLTNLPNRRGYKRDLDRADAHARRFQEPYTLLSMDLSGFKSINDHLGHDAGDTALKLVAQAFRETARAEDIFARWGGDEFTAILPGTPAEGVTAIVQRLEQAVAGINLGGHQIEIDIGAATYPNDEIATTDLLEIADRRMYERKNRRKTPERR